MIYSEYIAVCSPECDNGGVCLSSGICDCQPGWEGSDCRQGWNRVIPHNIILALSMIE